MVTGSFHQPVQKKRSRYRLSCQPLVSLLLQMVLIPTAGGVHPVVLLLSFQLVLLGTGCELLLQLFLGLKWCGSRRKFLVVPLLHGCLCWLDYQQEIDYCLGVYKCRILVFFVLMVLNPTTICSLTVRSRFRYGTSSVGVLSHYLLLISKHQSYVLTVSRSLFLSG